MRWGEPRILAAVAFASAALVAAGNADSVRNVVDEYAFPYTHLARDPDSGVLRFARRSDADDVAETGANANESVEHQEPSFLQVGRGQTTKSAASAMASAKTRESRSSTLFPVRLNFDVEQLPTSLLMVWDTDDAALRLDVGGRGGRGLAEATFSDGINYHGWAHLNVTIDGNNKHVDNDVKMYSAGFIEGILTSVRMSEFFANHHKLLLKSEASNHALLNIKRVLGKEIGKIKGRSLFEDHVLPEEPADAYGRQLRYLLFQLWGLLDGYNHMAKHYRIHTLQMVDLMMLNAFAEIQQMMKAYSPRAVLDRTEAAEAAATLVFLQKNLHNGGFKKTKTRRFDEKDDLLDDEHWEKRLSEDGHCTGYVRLTGTDLLMGHATWGDYAQMLRVYKFYDFALDGETIGRTIAMSSYPGLISSGDDYMITSSGLAIADTSLEILDSTLLDKVDDKPTVPGFMHLLTTTRLARSGADWASRYQRMNSGTRAAQWMVVDYNEYVPGQAPLASGTLWVVEVIPGYSEARDLSAQLDADKYFGSVNRPLFETTRKKTGFTAAEASHGSLYSVTESPRGVILKGAAPGSLLDMRGLMTENKWGAWPGPTSPGHDVAARMDLARKNPIPNGAIDAKIVNHCLARTLSVQAHSGPTDAGQKPFRWQKKGGVERFPGVYHYGLPNVWAFPWVQISRSGVEVGLSDIDDCPGA